MKKLLFLFGIAFLLISGLTFAKTNSEKQTTIVETQITLETEEEMLQGVHCKKVITRPDGTKEIKTCWICNCGNL